MPQIGWTRVSSTILPLSKYLLSVSVFYIFIIFQGLIDDWSRSVQVLALHQQVTGIAWAPIQYKDTVLPV